MIHRINTWLQKKYVILVNNTVLNLTSLQMLKLDTRKASAEFIQKNIRNTLIFSDRLKIQQYVLERTANRNGDIMEFGVAGGGSIKRFDAFVKSKNLDKKVFGFDSFLGLGETWTELNSYDDFNRGGIPPKLPKTIELIVGEVQATLPNFLKSYNGAICLIHIDTDSYAPAKFILSKIKDHLQVGTVILFDDYHGLLGWQYGEHLALNEELDSIRYRYIAFGPHQAAIEIV